MKTIYDIIIVGAGVAGLTSALYALRAERSVLILEKDSIGGQIAGAPRVENYPSVDVISGMELSNRMFEQVVMHGADFELEEVLTIVKIQEGEFRVATNYTQYTARSIILSAGVKPRTLGLPREEDLVGQGISYCALCDGAFFKGDEVAIVGGGNSALQYAVNLSGVASRVHVLVRTPAFTGDPALITAVSSLPNVDVHYQSAVEGYLGDSLLSGIVYTDPTGTHTLSVKGLFIAIGQQPDLTRFAHLVDLDEYGYFDADETCTTRTPGVFVAGDCRRKQYRQVVTATSDGAIAATSAIAYLGTIQ